MDVRFYKSVPWQLERPDAGVAPAGPRKTATEHVRERMAKLEADRVEVRVASANRVDADIAVKDAVDADDLLVNLRALIDAAPEQAVAAHGRRRPQYLHKLLSNG